MFTKEELMYIMYLIEDEITSDDWETAYDENYKKALLSVIEKIKASA